MILLSWLLTKIPFVKKAGIEYKILVSLFFLRIIFGVLNGYLNLYILTSSDTKMYHIRGLDEYHLLLSSPKKYFYNFLDNPHKDYTSGFFSASNSYWNDLKDRIIDKILSILDLFTFGDFFSNVLIYNFFIFLGSILMYKLFLKLFPAKSNYILIGIFCLPSFLFFSSGLHKEGLIFIGISIIYFNFYQIIDEKKYSFRSSILIVISFLFILLLRNYVLLLLIPSIIYWWICKYKSFKTLSTFVFGYCLLIFLFFSSGLLPNKNLSLPSIVAARQTAFIHIGKSANSFIPVDTLKGSIMSYSDHLLPALINSFLRPYLFEKMNLFYMAISFEFTVYILALFCFLLFRKRNSDRPILYSMVFFSISMFLIIGYTIPIEGAIVRYRSIFIPLLIIPILCKTDWEKAYKFIIRKI